MLAASAVGTVETSSITESIKQANPHVLYVQGSVRAVNAEERRITIETASSLSARGEAATESVELDYTTLVSTLLQHIFTNVALVLLHAAAALHIDSTGVQGSSSSNSSTCTCSAPVLCRTVHASMYLHYVQQCM
jgi:hypothetical protein